MGFIYFSIYKNWFLLRKKIKKEGGKMSRVLNISRERVRQILKEEGLPTKIKMRYRLSFADSENQPHHPHKDYCFDCGEALIGRGTKRIDRGERTIDNPCLLYTSPSPRDRQRSRMPSSA